MFILDALIISISVWFVNSVCIFLCLEPHETDKIPEIYKKKLVLKFHFLLLGALRWLLVIFGAKKSLFIFILAVLHYVLKQRTSRAVFPAAARQQLTHYNRWGWFLCLECYVSAKLMDRFEMGWQQRSGILCSSLANLLLLSERKMQISELNCTSFLTKLTRTYIIN